MPSSDTSNTERIRRLRAKTIAVAVANGVALPTGGSYEPVAALKLGHSAAVVETPGGPVTESGCGCVGGGGGASRTFTCNSDPDSYPVTDGTIFIDIAEPWTININYFDGNTSKPNPVLPSQSESGTIPTTIDLNVPNGAVQYNIQITCGPLIIPCNVISAVIPLIDEVSIVAGGAWTLTLTYYNGETLVETQTVVGMGAQLVPLNPPFEADGFSASLICVASVP
jgi:hypothetical protein